MKMKKLAINENAALEFAEKHATYEKALQVVIVRPIAEFRKES